jgi:hypothetical protein
MHHFALHDTGRELMNELGQFINCETCAAEYEGPKEEENLIIWSKDLHNKVNSKLGKWDKWDLTDFNIGQKPECDLCSQKETSSLYPWMFIHNVAESNSAALPFLQKFNQLYPCDVHKGTFFIDSPSSDESVLDWTIRNHKRFNPEFEYYSKNAQGDSTVNGSNCTGCTKS